MIINSDLKILPGSNTSIVPSLNDTLSYKYSELLFELIAKPFIRMRV